MGKITEEDHRFKEHLGGFFHDVFRAAGLQMASANAHEKLRAVGERMASTIEHATERKSIQVIKKLQTAVKDSFDKVEVELVKVQQLALACKAIIDDLVEEQKRLSSVIDDLSERVEELEADEFEYDPCCPDCGCDNCRCDEEVPF